MISSKKRQIKSRKSKTINEKYEIIQFYKTMVANKEKNAKS